VEAITATDKAVGLVYEAAQEAGYILMITADHGNAEQMKDVEKGTPFTAHTTNVVPFIMTGDPKVLKLREDAVERGDEEEVGALCDVAPTILDVMVRGFLLPWTLFMYFIRVYHSQKVSSGDEFGRVVLIFFRHDWSFPVGAYVIGASWGP